jgi:NitT/TauT family transport system substrate-binding protein
MGAIHSVLLAVVLVHAGPAGAMETVIAGAVGSASANLWPIYVGINKSLFAAEGIKVDLVFSQANTGTIQQLTVDALNVSIGSGLVDPIRAIDKGAPLAIVRIEAQRPPYAVLGKSGIKSLRELKGKVVSVGGAKDITRIFFTRIFFERMLRASGIEPKEVDLIFAGATSARYAALQSGAADAAILTAPYNFHAHAAGFSLLGLTSDVVDMPFSGVSTNRNWAGRNAATLRKFLAAYTKAIHWLTDSGNRREAAEMMVSVSNLKMDDVEKSYEFLVAGGFFETTGSVSRAKLGKVVAALQELGDIPANFSTDRLFLPSITQVSD